ncbi:MAG: polysaccharide deacetylase family protein [Acidobacteriota bacterium]
MSEEPKKRAPRPPLAPLLMVLLFGAGTFWVGGSKKDDSLQGTSLPTEATDAASSADPSDADARPATVGDGAGQGVPIAITIDDLPAVGRSSIPDIQALTAALLDELDRRQIQATGFVNSGKVAGDDRDERLGFLRQWLDRGHSLANHGAGHLSPNDVDVEEYLADIERCEPVLDELTDRAWRGPQFYRHPFLHTGADPETKERIATWLDERGYRVAPVTHENHDWMFSAAYDQRLKAGDAEGTAAVVDAYVEYTDQLFAFWEGVSEQLNGGPHPHVMLLHANQLNADHFGRVADVMERRGYRYVTLEEALEHPIYDRKDTYAGAGGVLWQLRWAQTDGVEIDWSVVPRPPEWIAEAFKNG